MRLFKLSLQCFRRFLKADIDLEGDVIAIVGPNEAGKSSLLEALRSFSDTQPLEKNLTRGAAPPRDWLLRARFLLEPEERALRYEVEGIGEEPRWYILDKNTNG